MSGNRFFASDNTAGIHPAVLSALARAAEDHAAAYGDDALTAQAIERVREHFGVEVEVFFVFGGTAANVLGLKAVVASHQAIICTDVAHINVDECGAPEQFIGCKLLAALQVGGKLTLEQVASRLGGIGIPHHVQPRVVSITQATEYGTVYRPDEIQALAHLAHSKGLFLHMDGARLANAAASLDLPLRALTGDVGVDLLSFGGTKNGLLAGEAVVFFDPARARQFHFIRKQGMQLASKMRFLAAQFDALLADGLWLRNARRANGMASRLAAGLAGVDGVTITQPVEANAVFAILPPAAVRRLQATYRFYVWDEERSEVRWMTSFDTAEADVDEFVSAIREAVSLG